MQDADLFVGLAGIAGVFVGFAALIAVRSGGASDAVDVGYMRGVVSFGMLAVIAALAPVTVGRYALSEHQVWAVSSALVLVGLVVLLLVMARTPEYRANIAGYRSSRLKSVESAASSVLAIAMGLAPIVIIVGVAPDLEAALYFTVVVLVLLGAGWVLLDLVYSQRSPADA
jgi:L-asparagine transporter-like permease